MKLIDPIRDAHKHTVTVFINYLLFRVVSSIYANHLIRTVHVPHKNVQTVPVPYLIFVLDLYSIRFFLELVVLQVHLQQSLRNLEPKGNLSCWNTIKYLKRQEVLPCPTQTFYSTVPYRPCLSLLLSSAVALTNQFWTSSSYQMFPASVPVLCEAVRSDRVILTKNRRIINDSEVVVATPTLHTVEM